MSRKEIQLTEKEVQDVIDVFDFAIRVVIEEADEPSGGDNEVSDAILHRIAALRDKFRELLP